MERAFRRGGRCGGGLLAMFSLLLLAGCQDSGTTAEDVGREAGETAEEVGREVDQAIEAAREAFYAQREEYTERVSGQVEELAGRIDSLSEMAQGTSSEAVEDVQRRLESIRGKLGQADTITEERWTAFRKEIEKEMEELKKASREVLASATKPF